MRELPKISPDLIEYLLELFPNEMPTEQLNMFEYGKLAGIQQTIQHIVYVYKKKT